MQSSVCFLLVVEFVKRSISGATSAYCCLERDLCVKNLKRYEFLYCSPSSFSLFCMNFVGLCIISGELSTELFLLAFISPLCSFILPFPFFFFQEQIVVVRIIT